MKKSKDKSRKRENAKLRIANAYGNVDVTAGCPSGHSHFRGSQLKALCRRLHIKCAVALVGFDDYRSGRYSPILDGVVVAKRSAGKLQAAIAERDERAARRHALAVLGLSLLSAVFTLNRRAKRCRELAQLYYQKEMHGLSGQNRREKERIYHLKGQVLQHQVIEGALAHGGYHRFPEGNWAELLTGDGYTFHRPCPVQSAPVEDLGIREAKPKGAKEPSLAVAYEMVTKYLAEKQIVAVYQWPARETQGWRDIEVASDFDAHDRDDGPQEELLEN